MKGDGIFKQVWYNWNLVCVTREKERLFLGRREEKSFEEGNSTIERLVGFKL